MTRWYRAYEGTVTDAKLGEAALVAECSRSVAIAAWHSILESCAAANDKGRFDVTARRIAVILCEPLKVIEALLAEFQALGMIEGSVVSAWSKRQYESDSSTERSRKHRDAKRNGGAMLQGRSATPPETETDTDTEIIPPPPFEPSARGANAEPEADLGGGDFEKIWHGFPKSKTESRHQAQVAFDELSRDEQAQFTASIGQIAAHIVRQNLTRPYNLASFIRHKRFVGFQASPAGSALKVRVEQDSPQGAAHEAFWRREKGRGVPWSNGGWWFDTEWPPDHKPEKATETASEGRQAWVGKRLSEADT